MQRLVFFSVPSTFMNYYNVPEEILFINEMIGANNSSTINDNSFANPLGGGPLFLGPPFGDHSVGPFGSHSVGHFGEDNEIKQILSQSFDEIECKDTPLKQNNFDCIVNDGELHKTECPICMDCIKRKEEYFILPCEHIFHKECINVWFNTKSTCPVCRHDYNKEK